VETRKGRVHQYLEAVMLVDVTTRIQPAGQRKCAERQVRSVCAYFDGSAPRLQLQLHSGWKRVAYDPRKDTAFMAAPAGHPEQAQRWNAAEAVSLNADGVTWVLNPRWES
jgi:hypothetical protein